MFAGKYANLSIYTYDLVSTQVSIIWSVLKELTLKAPITTAADDKFRNNFPNFQKK